MDLQLINKTAFVAGSSKGLGLATAKSLLNEGANVAFNGRNIDELNRVFNSLQNKNNSIIAQGDVTNPGDCSRIIHQTVDRFEGLDILITNCGGPKPGKFEELDENDWMDGLKMSFLSHVYLIKTALPYLKQSISPSILTITSFTVKQPLQNMILSNSIRAATIGMTKTLANELGMFNIRVNSILPGWTSTDRVEELLNNRSKKSGVSFEKEKESITRLIPLNRMGTPDEFARAAAFLVSPAASYITGIMFSVDGGIIQSLF